MFEERRVAPWLAIAGVCATALGVYFNFQLQRHSFISTSDFQFAFLQDASLPTLGLGLLASIGGGIVWARRASAQGLIVVGVSVVILVAGSVDAVPVNIHSWTADLMFVYAAATVAGVAFFVLGLARIAGGKNQRLR